MLIKSRLKKKKIVKILLAVIWVSSVIKRGVSYFPRFRFDRF